MTDNNDQLDLDITEALARSREPGRMWAMLRSIEDTAQRPQDQTWAAWWVMVAVTGFVLFLVFREMP